MDKKLLSFFTVLFVLNSCATYVDVKIQKPASISLGNVRNVAVSDFNFTGNSSFTEVGDAPISETLERIIEGQKVPKLNLKNAYSSKIISDNLITKLVDNGHYSVADRDEVYKVLEEQKLSLSGIINEKEAPEIGKLIGVGAFIIGSGKYFIKDKGGWYVRTNDKKIFKDVFYRIDRKVTVELNYKIISVENGQVIASKAIKKTKNLSAKGDDMESAFANISWKSTVDKLVNNILDKVIKQIAPYYSKTSREIKTGNSHSMKTGLEYAKRKLWEDAKESWESVLTDNSPNARQDRIHAMYNLGVYNEINSELDIAEEYFEKCFELSGKNEYLDARVRIQKRKKELVKLKEQNVE